MTPSSETPQAPAGGAGDNARPPAGSTGLRGEAWRKAARSARSAQTAARIKRGRTYTRVADRTAGSQYRPGMAVRRPQEPRGSEGG